MSLKCKVETFGDVSTPPFSRPLLSVLVLPPLGHCIGEESLSLWAGIEVSFLLFTACRLVLVVSLLFSGKVQILKSR